MVAYPPVEKARDVLYIVDSKTCVDGGWVGFHISIRQIDTAHQFEDPSWMGMKKVDGYFRYGAKLMEAEELLY